MALQMGKYMVVLRESQMADLLDVLLVALLAVESVHEKAASMVEMRAVSMVEATVAVLAFSMADYSAAATVVETVA